MSRKKRSEWQQLVTLLVLPALGLVVAAVGLVVCVDVPSNEGIADLAARLNRLRHEVDQLRERNEVERARAAESELTRELPTRLSMATVLDRLEHAARGAGVASISFEASAEGGVRRPMPDQGAVPDEPDTSKEPSAPEASEVHCSVSLVSSYASLVRFLAMVETAKPVTRVRELTIEDDATEVRARIDLTSFYYAPKDQMEVSR